jgi:long-chain acyl-CoA synthetase
MFYTQAESNKGKVTLKYKKEGKWIDIRWDEEKEYVESFALGLMKLGIESGEKIAILSENRYEWYVSDLAIQSIGGIVVPIYATNTPEQIKYIMNNSESVAIVVSTSQQLDKVKSIKKDIPKLKYIITLQELASKIDNTMNFSSILALGRSSGLGSELKKRFSNITSEDIATIIYTSGTTGDPKGVMLTHRNLLSDAEATYEVIKSELSDGDITLSFLPLSHSFARTADYYVPIFHAKGIQALAESLEKLSENLIEIKPTMFVSVPRVFEKVYGKVISQVEADKPIKRKIFYWAVLVGKQASSYLMDNKPMPFLLSIKHKLASVLVFEKIKGAMGGRLKFASSGGAPLPKELGEFFFALGIKIIEGYGLTETSPIITVNPPNKFKFGTVGKPIPGCELKIAYDGEILARGSMIMKGYYKKPEATKEVIDSIAVISGL